MRPLGKLDEAAKLAAVSRVDLDPVNQCDRYSAAVVSTLTNHDHWLPDAQF